MQDTYSDAESYHICVIIPAYNVERHIINVVTHIPLNVRSIVVVDDCSPDNSAQVIQSCLSSRVHLVRHAVNQGVGGAMLTGYAKALELGADIIVKMDGDDQMDPSYLLDLVRPIIEGHADYTKGNRFLHSYALGQMPLARRIGNFGLTFLTKLASGYWNMFDPNNGYTAIHRNVVQLLNTNVIARRYFFESSMLIELRRINAVVRDVPMPARYGSEVSSMSLRRVLIDFPERLLIGFFRRLRWQYFLYNFTAASLLIISALPLIAFGLIWGLYYWYVSITSGRIATTGTVLIAVLPIIVGVQFLVQALVLDIMSVPHEAIHPHVHDPRSHTNHMASLLHYENATIHDMSDDDSTCIHTS